MQTLELSLARASSRMKARNTATNARARAAAGILTLVSAATGTSFVPQHPTTEWLELTALRRPGYAFIHANLPLKTLVAPMAVDGACGFLPPSRDVGCQPALLNWLYSQHPFDRTDLWLRLHATPQLVMERSVWKSNWNTATAPSGVPGQSWLARSLAKTVRQPLPVCVNGTLNGTDCKKFNPYDADLGGLGSGAARWEPQQPGYSGIDENLVIDTPSQWNVATSPKVLAEGRAGAGQVEYTFGQIHATDERLIYPKLTALQYIFTQPHLRVLSELLNSTCYCPPSVPVCWYSWLCIVFDQAVFTLLAPIDTGFSILTPDALHYLFDTPRAGYLTIAYHILGPAMFSKYRPFLDFLDETPTRRLSVDQEHKMRRLGSAVNTRLASLHAQRQSAERVAGKQMSAALNELQRVSDTSARANELARRLALGTIGEQSLAGYTETDNYAFDIDDVLLWRAMPGILPFNSYMYLAQIKDLLKVTGPSLMKTFSSLVVRNASCNSSVSILRNDTATRRNVFAPYPASPPPVPASFDPPYQDKIIQGVYTNESQIQRAYEQVGFSLDSSFLNSTGPCARIMPARLIASLGDPFLCKNKCKACDACHEDCQMCRTQFGSNSPLCFQRCSCAHTCSDCSACKWAYPSSHVRRLSSSQKQANLDRLTNLATTVSQRSDTTSSNFKRSRRLSSKGEGSNTITFTCTEEPFDCGIFEPTCRATTLPGNGNTDIETLNAVIHKVNRPLLPPPILLAMYAEGIMPYMDGPDVPHPRPVCPFLSANSYFSLPFELRADFFK